MDDQFARGAKDFVPAPGAEPENFQSLLESYATRQRALRPGDVVRGSVLSLTNSHVLLDIGFKSEGRIPLEQVRREDFFSSLAKGSLLEAVVESLEDQEGYILLSFEKVSKQKFFVEIEAAYLTGRLIAGTITEVVKGGLIVDIGVRAFLPGSQIDLHPVRNPDELLGQRLEFRVIQFNKLRRNIVVSRRAVLEGEQDKLREETLHRLTPGSILEGVVKNITEYGVFINLGGLDGLLHKTDISWGRVCHPADFFQLGQRVRVLVLHHDPESRKISLGYKQLEPDPWKDAAARFPPGAIAEATVQSRAPYGLFVEIEKGIEGLIHKSELSWNTCEEVSLESFRTGARLPVLVLSMDVFARRLSLSLRRTRPNPWEDFQQAHRKNGIIQGTVRGVSNHGLVVEAAPGIFGRVHRSDTTWNRNVQDLAAQFQPGQGVRAVILELNAATQQLTLGLKQLEEHHWDDFFARHRIGDQVEGVVTRRLEFGAFVRLAEGIEGLCHVSEFPDWDAPELERNLRAGLAVQPRIIRLNPAEKKIGLSLRAPVAGTAAPSPGAPPAEKDMLIS
jgi:small subunit ribosomal protein S1